MLQDFTPSNTSYYVSDLTQTTDIEIAKISLQILIVDELVPMRHHMINLLAKVLPMPIDFYVASSEKSALSIVPTSQPDLVIVDTYYQESDSSGMRIAQAFWNARPQTKILFWSRRFRYKHIRDLQKIAPSGSVYGYVLKDEPDSNIAYAVDNMVLHNNIFCRSDLKQPPDHVLAFNGLDEPLTDSEEETLHDVAIGLTDKAIANRRHISVRGVQNRLSSLCFKLLGERAQEDGKQTTFDVYNQRMRLVCQALCLGMIDEQSIQTWMHEYALWNKNSGNNGNLAST